VTIEVLRELYRVTEWKDDSVYKTEYIKDVWVPLDEADKRPSKDEFYSVKSTSYQGETIRRVK